MGYYIDLKNITIDKYKKILKTTDLIPSWKILEEDVDKNLNKIKKYDVKNLNELLIALKDKSKIQNFSKQSGLSEKYLSVLKRVVNGFLPKPNRIKDFTFISKNIVAKLEDMDLKNTLKLYEEIRTRKKRNEFSKKIGIDKIEVMKLTKLTDLSRIRWVNHTFAYVLLEAGYDTVEKVANANYKELYEIVKKLNHKRKIYNANIGERDMKMVIEAAKRLDIEIEYQ